MSVKSRILSGFVWVVMLLVARPVDSQTRVTSEGTDFIFGILPIGNTASGSSGTVYNPTGHELLVSGMDSAQVSVYYFDANGKEILDATYALGTSGLEIPLNAYNIFAYNWDTPQYKAVHVTANHPVTLQLLSQGNDNGEMALILPTIGLNTEYVACATENVAADPGHLLVRDWNALPGHSMALVVGAFDGTIVTIKPSTLLADGNFGLGDRTLSLTRGQVALIEADTTSTGDISGTFLSANKPFAVFAGNNNAGLPDLSAYVSGHPTDNFRNPVVEQMIPVKSWDSAGYVAIPFFAPNIRSANTPGSGGNMYRIVSKAPEQLNLAPLSQVTSLSSNVSELGHVSSAQTIGNTGGPISALQYDYFTGLDVPGGVVTFTAPASCNLIPISHWKKSYTWIAPQNSDYHQGQYANIIYHRDQLSRLKLTKNGLIYPLNPLASFDIPNHPELFSMTIRLDPGMYRISSDSDLIVYHYGRTENAMKFAYAYAAPCGLTLSTDNYVPLSITVDTLCDRFEVHLHDTRPKGYRVSDISLYTDSVQAFRSGLLLSRNFRRLGNLPSLLDSDITITVHTSDGSKPANGYLYIHDGLHAEFVLHLVRDWLAPWCSVSQVNIRALKDLDTCVTIELHNSDKNPVTFTSGRLMRATNFSLGASPTFPLTLQSGDSVALKLCASASDHDIAHLDTLAIEATCELRIPLSITGLQPRINWDRDAQTDTLVCGSPDTIRVVLTNNSASKATEIIDDVSIIGPDNAEFKIVGNQFGYPTLTNFPLNYGESLWISVAFQPDMTKPLSQRWLDRTATLVARNSIHSDPTMSLVAHVTFGSLSTSASSYDFGTVPINAPQTTTINITNSGTAAVRITRIDNADPSVQLFGIAVGNEILPGGSIPITVTDIAQSLQPVTAHVELWGDGICVPPAELTFTIAGVAATHNTQTTAISTGLPATYTCKHSQGTIVIKNLGTDPLRIVDASIISGAGLADSAVFRFGNGRLSLTIDSLLPAEAQYLLDVDYHPTIGGAHGALVAYRWDSLGTIVTSFVELHGTATSALSELAESATGIDTVIASHIAVPFYVPVYLLKDLPAKAAIDRATITVSFARDLFRYVTTIPAGNFGIASATSHDIGDRTYLTVDLTADTISANGKLCDIELTPFVARTDTSALRIESIECRAFNGDTVCTTAVIHPATIQIYGGCGDSILRSLMRGDPLHVFAVSVSNQMLNVDLSANAPLHMVISDVLGHNVLSDVRAVSGRTTILLSVQSLPSGSYELIIEAGRERRISKFVVSK